MSANRALDLLREIMRLKASGDLVILPVNVVLAAPLLKEIKEHLAFPATHHHPTPPTNPRPWRAVEPGVSVAEPEGWTIEDALGDTVAVLSHGSPESDRAAAEMIVEAVNSR